MAQTQTLAILKDVIEKFLVSVCRFTADAAKEITKNQGYDELDKFYLLNNKGVNTLCSIVRKPHASASRGTSGHAISNLAQERQKLAIFTMKHFKCVSCKIDLDSLTKKDIIMFSQQRQMELIFKDKTEGFAQATFKILPRPLKWSWSSLSMLMESQAFSLPMYPIRISSRWMKTTTLQQIIPLWMPRRLPAP